MVSFEEAGSMLDEAAEALPEEIFKSLNGGVNLLPDERASGDGRWTLGLYHNDVMGRRVEIFYGSFVRLYGDIPPEEFRRHLVKTLHHELTHHIEGLAGDRTLERWDEEQTALWLSGGEEEPLKAESLLFVDEDDCALAPAVLTLFIRESLHCAPPTRCTSAGLRAGSGVVPEAAKAASAFGVDFSAHMPTAVSAALLGQYDAVLCMTLAQADALAARFPEYDEKILCLGETDIHPPKHKSGWGAVMRRLRGEARALVEELYPEA